MAVAARVEAVMSFFQFVCGNGQLHSSVTLEDVGCSTLDREPNTRPAPPSSTPTAAAPPGASTPQPPPQLRRGHEPIRYCRTSGILPPRLVQPGDCSSCGPTTTRSGAALPLPALLPPLLAGGAAAPRRCRKPTSRPTAAPSGAFHPETRRSRRVRDAAGQQAPPGKPTQSG